MNAKDKYFESIMEIPETSPWGDVEAWDHIAPGILIVMTADGKSGYMLSDERNAMIPEEYRDSLGCYDEDQWPIIGACFKTEYVVHSLGGSENGGRDIAKLELEIEQECSERFKLLLPMLRNN